MKYKIIILMLLLLVIPILNVDATTIGQAKRGDCIDLYQICENCTYNNISTILYPNKSIAITSSVMSIDTSGTYFNYTYCSPNSLGKYIVNGFGDLDGVKTSWVYDFEVTGTGFEFTQSRSIFYIASLTLLVFLFIITLFAIPQIPSGNDTDEFGSLISINNLKYIRPVLFCIAWILLLAIVFISSNISLAYMGGELIGKLFFTLYTMMFIITLPGFIIYFIFIFVQIFRDKEMKKLLERGVELPRI